MLCECQEVTAFLSLPQCRGQSTCARYRSGWGAAELPLFHYTLSTATSPGRKPEALVTKTPQARTGLKRAKQMPGTGRAQCLTKGFLLQERSVLAHAAGGIWLCLIALKTGGRRKKRRRPVKCVYVWEEQRRVEERMGVPAPEMCQRSFVPPGPEHQPGTTSGGGSRERKVRAEKMKLSRGLGWW